MKSVWLIIFISLLPYAVMGKGQSIMFEEKPNPIFEKPKSGGDGKAEYCKALQAKIDKLKGKPQRRYTAIQRYNDECLRYVNPAPE